MVRNTIPIHRFDIRTPTIDSITVSRLSSAAQAIPGFKTYDPNKRISLYPVSHNAPIHARKAMEVLGYYFKREFEYDSPPYEAHDPGHSNDRHFLFVLSNLGDNNNVVGAMSFRWRIYQARPAGLALSWVWLHPYLRRHGILSAYWPLLVAVCGAYTIESPLSAAMQGFLQKVDPQRATT